VTLFQVLSTTQNTVPLTDFFRMKAIFNFRALKCLPNKRTPTDLYETHLVCHKTQRQQNG